MSLTALVTASIRGLVRTVRALMTSALGRWSPAFAPVEPQVRSGRRKLRGSTRSGRWAERSRSDRRAGLRAA